MNLQTFKIWAKKHLQTFKEMASKALQHFTGFHALDVVANLNYSTPADIAEEPEKATKANRSTRRKYKPGRALGRMEVMIAHNAGEPIFWRGKWYHHGWWSSWTYRYVMNETDAGRIRQVLVRKVNG